MIINRKIRVLAMTVCFCSLLTSCVGLRSAEDVSPATDRTAFEETTGPVLFDGSETLSLGTDILETTVTDEVTETSETASETDVKDTLSAEALRWVELSSAPSDIIMTPDEIAEDNLRMLSECPELIDILAIPAAISGEEVYNIVSERSQPKGNGPWYDHDKTEIPGKHVAERREACALDLIPCEVNPKPAVAVERGHLRAFPDDKPYYLSSNSKYDTIQHTEIRVGMPLWVLHTSRDGDYLFVAAYHYNGWIKAESVAVTEDSALWRSFASPDSFVCVTDTMVTLPGEVNADMGTVLPLVGKNADAFAVIQPKRAENGTLETTEATVPLESASEGYLPYTYENYIAQAFKYEGTPYGWGGLDDGVDCSGFISNVMRTFGFMLPRDTKHQAGRVGRAHSMEGKNHAEISDFLDGISEPMAVYYPGHVLFYLGHDAEDGKHYFIHAPQIGENVQVTSKENLSGMTYACRFAG